MGILQEFKTFAVKGNVVDMAVGVIIGAAFGKIVASAVEDLIMPPIGLAVGGMDFSSYAVELKAAIGDKPAVMFRYGKFLQVCLDFAIMAFAIFLMVKMINKLRQDPPPPPPAEPPVTKDQLLLAEIRDLLASQGKPVPSSLAEPAAELPVVP